MDELRMVGKWWLSETPEVRVGGVLEIDTNGRSRLELTDSLAADMGAKVVHGAADGRHVTLLECLPANGGKITVGEQYTVVEVFRSRVVLVGVHLGSEDEQAFDGLEVELANLTAWTQRTGIDRRSFYKADEDGSDKLKFRRITVDPSELDSVSAQLKESEVIPPGISGGLLSREDETYGSRIEAVLG